MRKEVRSWMRSGMLLEIHWNNCISHLASLRDHCVFITDCKKLKLWLWDGLEWHIIHAEFRENRASILKFAFDGDMIGIACGTCFRACNRI
jgi:hypothetical protein